ncbi:hypothetical protein LENED_004513 [Lentinula edodes]|uniref:Uncharacterized protein n=1 Tax=Lentinula edodes TaxID=5353 RepID=A0A1Q3E6J4_LENED|nr:hypothetical protein LENED_004513 [Lentinula edodes]
MDAYSLNGLALGSRKSQCLIERWPEPEDVWRRRRLPNGLGDYTHLSHLGWYITALAHQFVRNVCFRVCGCSGLS